MTVTIESIRQTGSDDTLHDDGSGWRVWFNRGTAITDIDGNIEFSNSVNVNDELCQAVKDAIRLLTPSPVSIEEVFVRFGKLPKNGYSTNHATGEKELGVSCYEAEWNCKSAQFEIVGSGLVGAIATYIITGAPVYLISGEVVGTGSDGEPVLRNAEVLHELKPASDNTICKHYVLA